LFQLYCDSDAVMGLTSSKETDMSVILKRIRVSAQGIVYIAISGADNVNIEVQDNARRDHTTYVCMHSLPIFQSPSKPLDGDEVYKSIVQDLESSKLSLQEADFLVSKSSLDMLGA
jgi:hypothetical protein